MNLRDAISSQGHDITIIDVKTGEEFDGYHLLRQETATGDGSILDDDAALYALDEADYE